MTTQPTRRGFLKAAAWTVPAVTVVAAAPAYATSLIEPTPPTTGCTISGTRIKKPGRGKGRNRWVYQLDIRCTGRTESVIVRGKPATRVRGDVWTIELAGKHHVLPVSVTTAAGVVSQSVVIR